MTSLTKGQNSTVAAIAGEATPAQAARKSDRLGTGSPTKSKPAPKAQRKPVTKRPAVNSSRPGSKTAKVVSLLRRPKGATTKELIKATGVAPDGFRLQAGTEALDVFSDSVSDGYFATLNMPIVRGREFQPTDTVSAPRVAVVNEQFARKYYANQDPIGKRLRMGGSTGPMVEIVGVSQQSIYLMPGEPAQEYLYLPAAQEPRTGMTLLLHTTGDPGDLVVPLRQLVQRLDATQPIVGVRTMQEVYDQRGKASVNMLTHSLTAMGLLGLTLALVGLYGLMTYTVGLQQRELGIRMALGANPAGVLRMVMRQGMKLAGAGVSIGLLLSLMASKALTAGLGVHSFNAPLLGVVVVGLLGIGGLGAYIPARRASLLDPNIVLRQD